LGTGLPNVHVEWGGRREKRDYESKRTMEVRSQGGSFFASQKVGGSGRSLGSGKKGGFGFHTPLKFVAACPSGRGNQGETQKGDREKQFNLPNQGEKEVNKKTKVAGLSRVDPQERTRNSVQNASFKDVGS